MFKKVKKKQFRRERTAAEGDEVSDNDLDERESSSIEDAKVLQKMRQRQHGVSADDLGAVRNVKKEEKKKHDPFKIETGGFVDMKNLKKSEVTEEVEEQIGTTFASETNRRDEDAQMLKYVEQELRKRKGGQEEEDTKAKTNNAEDALYELPEHIKAMSKIKKSEDMLSNQMLSGIPEVDLGIEAKIKNIEQTEDAKAKLLADRMKKKEEGISLVPTNYAVNFVQHNRFNIEDPSPILKKGVEPAPAPVRVGDADRPDPGTNLLGKRSKDNDKATDDVVYDKFKKQMRRF